MTFLPLQRCVELSIGVEGQVAVEGRRSDKIFPRGDVSNKPLPGVSLIWPIFISIVARMTMERGKAISVRSYQGNFERNAPFAGD